MTPNTFCTYTKFPSEAEVETTIFFVSGNPGLIGYYHPFLSLLARYLGQDPGNSKTPYQIYGCSLGGFEVDHDDASETAESMPRSTCGTRRDMNGTAGRQPQLYDLEDQIRFVHGKLMALMERNVSAKGRRKIILVGHSVGAYIAMEVLRRHRETTSNGKSPLDTTQSNKTSSVDFDIVGGVMLFPTVIDIALSPSGQKLTVGLISSLIHILVPQYTNSQDDLIDPSIHDSPIRLHHQHPSSNPHIVASRIDPPHSHPLNNERPAHARARNNIYIPHQCSRRTTSPVRSHPLHLNNRTLLTIT